MSGTFRIWRAPCPCVACRLAGHWHWRWECTMCQPPAWGCRHGLGAWDRIVRISLPHHLRVRLYHHRHVRAGYHDHARAGRNGPSQALPDPFRSDGYCHA